MPTVVDLSGESYSEFDLLGLTVRRVGTALYQDMMPGDATFDAGCGINFGVWQVPGLHFVSYGTPNHTYQPTITKNTPAAELLLLDAILESMKGV